MSSTVVVRGAGGAIFEMDVPTSGPALARWSEALVKGDLVVVEDEVEWVDAGGGAVKLVVVDKSAATPSKSKPEPKAKAGADAKE